uniref:50S ribosomal protein L16 n=1 Tax=Lygus hesperus TaxID=30085 RepID=A0A0A9VP04_LYGHE
MRTVPPLHVGTTLDANCLRNHGCTSHTQKLQKRTELTHRQRGWSAKHLHNTTQLEMPRGELQRVIRLTGLPRVVKLYPNVFDRARYRIASGSAYPSWWEAYRHCPPKQEVFFGPLERLQLPLDSAIREVLHRLPMLRKEELNYDDPTFIPFCTRIAAVWTRLQQDEQLDKETAFLRCQDDIFHDELYVRWHTVRTAVQDGRHQHKKRRESTATTVYHCTTPHRILPGTFERHADPTLG